jgi:hypothetical protein
MSSTAVNRLGKRAAARLRAIRRGAAAWQRAARRAATLALVTAGTAALPSLARAQTGQMAMAPAGGVVNRAMAGFQNLNLNGPGYLYYGINAADRGLGYNGSYMTLGGYVPYAEDDLGGLWAADLRGHVSVYGGFFSNVGAVRKQYIGGTLLGIGVYWDYDGDENQYPTSGLCGTQFGQFGHSYNQVGVSGEWLTDFGNLRSNGYMPVGTTAYTVGAPGTNFHQNFVMCQYGLDAALSGADLEVGAYIPGLSDWAGMISVGGYALGNARYNWWQGPQTGKDVVPWFGGVYTRLDMTFIENWDFSLQANNDSFFDWTGFARLTYRMGGSRRRNVPDQMEQPMMRNEHIVRAHQTPIVAVNPITNTPYRVIHVNNAAVAAGLGTAEAPVTSLAAAQTLATNPGDIVFVHVGNSATAPYQSAFSFAADNQMLIGEGSTILLPTCGCGPTAFFAGANTGLYPILTNPGGTAVSLRNGAIVDHLQITGAQVALANGPGLTSGGVADVNDVRVLGTGVAGQRGIAVVNGPAGAKLNFTNMYVKDMTNNALFVDGGGASVDVQGRLETNTATNGGITNAIVQVQNTTGGTINVARTAGGLSSALATNPRVVQTNAIVDAGTSTVGAGGIAVFSTSNTDINVSNATITNAAANAVLVQSVVSGRLLFENSTIDGTNVNGGLQGDGIAVVNGRADIDTVQVASVASGFAGISALADATSAAATTTVRVQGSTINAGATSNGVFAQANAPGADNAQLNLTVANSTVNLSGALNAISVVANAGGAGSSTANTNLNANAFSQPTTGILLNGAASTTITYTQANQAALSAANGGATVTTPGAGAVTPSGPVPPTP